MNVLFVCTGNTCRSPMAEAIMRRLVDQAGMAVHVQSAGLRSESTVAPPAIETLEKRGIHIGQRPSVQLTEDMVADATLTLCATTEQRGILVEAIPTSESRVFVWGDFVARASALGSRTDMHELLERLSEGEPEPNHDLADPVGQDQAVYEEMADKIEQLAVATLDILGCHPPLALTASHAVVVERGVTGPRPARS
jgi:protein-tyrosine phosphatase